MQKHFVIYMVVHRPNIERNSNYYEVRDAVTTAITNVVSNTEIESELANEEDTVKSILLNYN